MHLTVHTDGGSLNNPGKAACAYVISKDDGKIIKKEFCLLGVQTNNIAEYEGVKQALLALLSLKKKTTISSLSFISDSLLLVNQLNGLYKIKNEKIRSYVFEIHSLEQQMNIPISYKHVLREYNQEADSLVKECLSSHHS